MLANSVAINVPATTSTQHPTAEAFIVAPVRPIAKFAIGPNREAWVLEVNKAAGSGVAGAVSLASNVSVPPLLDAFINAYSLNAPLQALETTATDVFGAANVTITRRLESDPDIGRDFVKVGIKVANFTRDAFRPKRDIFDTKIENLPDGTGFERLVVVVSRSA